MSKRLVSIEHARRFPIVPAFGTRVTVRRSHEFDLRLECPARAREKKWWPNVSVNYSLSLQIPTWTISLSNWANTTNKQQIGNCKQLLERRPIITFSIKIPANTSRTNNGSPRVHNSKERSPWRGGGALPKMAYTGRLRPKWVPFSRFRYMKG